MGAALGSLRGLSGELAPTLCCVHFCVFHRVLSGDLALSMFSDPRLFAIFSGEGESGLSVIPAGVMPQRDGLALVL